MLGRLGESSGNIGIMASAFTIRFAEAADHAAWSALWKGYQTFYEIELDEEITEKTWERLLAREPMGAMLAEDAEGRCVGFLNYVLHPITWSTAPVCYLEDLYVDPASRGAGAARGLIEALAAMGKDKGWHRIYWHTARDNVRAQALYTKLAERTGWVRYDLDLD